MAINFLSYKRPLGALHFIFKQYSPRTWLELRCCTQLSVGEEGANQGIISGQKTATEISEKSHNPFYICWVLMLSDCCFRFSLRDWTMPKLGQYDWAQIRHDRIISPEPMQSKSANSVSCWLYVCSKCFSIFRKVTREQNLEAGSTLVWQTFGEGIWGIPLLLNFLIFKSWELNLHQSCLLTKSHILQVSADPSLHVKTALCRNNLRNLISCKTHLYTNVLRQILLEEEM